MLGVLRRAVAGGLKPRVSSLFPKAGMHAFPIHDLARQSMLPITLLKPLVPMEPSTKAEEMFTDSVMRKRKLKIKKHKLRKRRKRQKAEKRKQTQGK
ncbi:LANO_0E01288g1_1 [Lachancea nothofagi CBS 11611]|uniref:LANO_0E01288g1_1 n=1 Tax=Lachancea nothofagi CBS 11611 TaxID=1266666 RepID=A0A1G4JP98_9SACH|nr:LANO_0E01288g1_1 [Lachancea nothofagi CBS 11611]